MWWYLLSAPAAAMTVGEAVDAALERSPMLAVSQARVEEAEARVGEAVGRLLPSAQVGGGVLFQTPIEVDLASSLPIPVPDPSQLDPLVVAPGTQLQGNAEVVVPLLAPAGWAARRTARQGVAFAEEQVEADRQALTLRVLEAFYASVQAHAVLEDAERAEALAVRLLEKGRTLAELGAVSEVDVLPFERAVAQARANLALAREGVSAADGVLAQLTGLEGAAEAAEVPSEVPSLDALLAALDRPDLRAAEARADVARSQVGLARATGWPTVGVRGGVMAVTPAPDLGAELTWRVTVGAQVPLFQGGMVASRVRQARAQVSQAESGARALREAAEIEIRRAHGALSQALSSLAEQEEAVRLAKRSVQAAEARVDEGGGSLLQLQQAQLEEVAAEVLETRARSAAARASDMLQLVVAGVLER